MKLWKYNAITGYWVYEREVNEDTAKQWLAVFKKAEPDCLFRVGRNKPTGITAAEDKKLIRVWKKKHQRKNRSPAEERCILRAWQRGEGSV